MFGNPTAQPAQQGTGLFGSNIFGANNAQQQQPAQQSGGGFNLFGNKPATTNTAPTTNLFSGFAQTNANTSAPVQTSLFGSLGQSTAQPATNAFGGGGSLFGSKPATTLSAQPTQGALGGSLFGSTLGASNTVPAQGTLTASIAQPIGANLPVFNLFPPGPRSIALDQSSKKKSGLFMDVPTRTVMPRLHLGYTPANSKLRGFTSSTSGNTNLSSTLTFSNGNPNALSLSKSSNKSLLGPDAFLNSSTSSPNLGSGGRQSVKKLILDKRIEPSDLFSKSNGFAASKVMFNPHLSVAARELEAAARPSEALAIQGPGTPAQKGSRFHADDAASSTEASTSPTKPVDPAELKHGDYYSKPDFFTIKREVGHEELAMFEGLVIGRVGFGEIHFLEPVDLTALNTLDMLFGDVIRFDDKECGVYTDWDEADKPTPGSGLNVKSRIILEHCWAVEKGKRDPIKDVNHPSAMKHLKRLKNMKGTHFESFEMEEGKWTFTVDHF